MLFLPRVDRELRCHEIERANQLWEDVQRIANDPFQLCVGLMAGSKSARVRVRDDTSSPGEWNSARKRSQKEALASRRIQDIGRAPLAKIAGNELHNMRGRRPGTGPVGSDVPDLAHVLREEPGIPARNALCAERIPVDAQEVVAAVVHAA